MKKLQKPISCLLVCTFFLLCVRLPAESVDDKYAEITPVEKLDSGEYIHGQGYGKILIRVLMFGSVPKQGVHYVPEGTDLMFAILYAGGYAENSSLTDVTIRRRGVLQLIHVDLDGLINDGQPIPRLVDGDVVTVPFNWRKDLETITLITGFLSSITALTLSIVALKSIH